MCGSDVHYQLVGLLSGKTRQLRVVFLGFRWAALVTLVISSGLFLYVRTTKPGEKEMIWIIEEWLMNF